MPNFALAFFVRAGRTPSVGLRGARLLGDAGNGGNAGSLCLSGGDAVSAAYAGYGAFLNNP